MLFSEGPQATLHAIVRERFGIGYSESGLAICCILTIADDIKGEALATLMLNELRGA